MSTIHTHSVFYDDSGIETNNDQVTIQDSYLNRIITKYFKECSADLNIQNIAIVVHTGDTYHVYRTRWVAT